MDETLKLKLSISRDVHSEFMRKLLGKTHYETVFGDNGLPLIYSCSSRDSSPQENTNSPNGSIMSIFEFCVVCDSIPSPIPGSPSKRRTTIPPAPNLKPQPELSRKFTFSSLLTELNDYSATGGTSEMGISRSTVSSPVKFPKPRANTTENIDSLTAGIPQILGSSSSSSGNSPKGPEKQELFDGMIQLDAARGASEDLASLKSTSQNQLMLNIGSASTRLDDSSFQGVVDQSVSSSLSTPTMTQSPNLSRSTSNENLHQLARGSESSHAESAPEPVSFFQFPQQPQPPLLNQLPQQHSYPFGSVGYRQPVIAKRNPKIDKMISNRSISPNGGGKLLHSISRSVSASHSHSFYECGGGGGNSMMHSMSLHSSSLILDGIAGSENKYVLNNPHSRNIKSKPLYSLFPNTNKKNLKKSSSTDATTITQVPRLPLEEIINNRKLMARKMREVRSQYFSKHLYVLF